MSPKFSNNSFQKKSDDRRILSEFQWKKQPTLPINKNFKLLDHPVCWISRLWNKLLTGSKSELQISPIRSSMVTNIRNSSYRSGELLELQNEKFQITWSPSMLKADSSDGDEGLVRHWLVVVSMGDEVTILEGGEFLKVAPDTNSIRSAWSKTWLDESKRLNEDSTWALIVMFVCFVLFDRGFRLYEWACLAEPQRGLCC